MESDNPKPCKGMPVRLSPGIRGAGALCAGGGDPMEENDVRARGLGRTRKRPIVGSGMIIRHRHKGRFTPVPNSIFEDDRLSIEAKGLLGYPAA